MPQRTQAIDPTGTKWTDTKLVDQCLQGREEAWSALVDKYKSLIYSIPVKYGFNQDDATDIFQAVCLELLSELGKLRKPKALPKWIMQVTAHKCIHHKKQMQRMVTPEDGDDPFEKSIPARAEEILRQAEEEQALRVAMSQLPPRCRELIRLLFFEEPARPYQELAAELGLSPGSIGFTRQRCLDRLRKRLAESGFS